MATSSEGRHPTCLFQSEKPWLDLQYHKDKTIKRPHELEEDIKDPPGPIDADILDRIHGSMVGMALGDALGAHVEFRPRQYMVKYPVTDLKGGGTWGLNIGEFTDDTSMALCLANSLVARRDFSPYDQLVRYKWWFKKGYMSSTGECFDIGSAVRQSLTEFERRQEKFAKEHKIPLDQLDYLSDSKLLNEFNVLCSEKGVAGNGALMRLAPMPLLYYRDPHTAVDLSGFSGLITHGDWKARDACRYYAALIVGALQGKPKEELLDNNFYQKNVGWFIDADLEPAILEIAQGSFKRGGYEEGIRGKGYIVNALEAALWAFYNDGGSFEKGARDAVNLGDDTDTTAAIYGQLAGAYYGYKNLPERWKEKLYAKNYIAGLSKWIYYEGSKLEIQGPKTSSVLCAFATFLPLSFMS